MIQFLIIVIIGIGVVFYLLGRLLFFVLNKKTKNDCDINCLNCTLYSDNKIIKN